MKTIKFAWIDDSNFGNMPTRKHSTDAGIDLCYAGLHMQLFPNDVQILKTRLLVEIPQGYFGWITNKSKNNFLVGGGIIDNDYQGEILIKLFNPTDNVIEISDGMAIAQLILLPCYTPEVEMVEPTEIHTKKTLRGESGGILSQLNTPYDDKIFDDRATFFEEVAEEMDDSAEYDYAEDDRNYHAMLENSVKRHSR